MAVSVSAAWAQPSTMLPAAMEGQAAASAPAQSTRDRYLVGAVLEDSPPYPGAGFRKVELRPMLAFRWGRWRISTSRATALMDIGAEAAGSGASTDLIDAGRWKFGIALRYDSGRKSAQSPQLAGMPDVPRTLRGRLYATYLLSSRWSLQSSASQDLLDHGGGLVLREGLGYTLPFRFADTPMEWNVGLGLGWADRTHLQTRYGISADQSITTGLPAFGPSSGLIDWSVGTGVNVALSSRWVMFGSVSSSRLLGDAARSPLTVDRGNTRLSLGLAYRCCQ